MIKFILYHLLQHEHAIFLSLHAKKLDFL